MSMKYLFVIIFSLGLLWSCTDHDMQAREMVTKGNTLMFSSDYNGAIEAYNQAISHNPELLEAYLQRGNAWFNLRNAEKAIADFDQIIAIDSSYADAWYNRGNVWFFLKENDKACADWKVAEHLGKPNVRDKTRFCQ